MATPRHPPSRCACGKTIAAWLAVIAKSSSPSPRPGAWTICGHCARLYRFTADLGLEPVDSRALKLARRDRARIERARAIVLAIRDRRN